MKPSVIRSYDIRGKINVEIFLSETSKLGAAIGTFLKRKHGSNKILVGHDIRRTSPAFYSGVLAGLMSVGFDEIFAVGRSSFGVTLFNGWDIGVDISSYITASHLPPENNGIKLYTGDGVGLSAEDLKEIGTTFFEENFLESNWKEITSELTTVNDASERYVNFYKEHFDLSDLKVVYDPGGGSTALIAKKIFEAVKTKNIGVFDEVNPLLNFRDPEPGPESLNELSSAVVNSRADFGVGFDGDGDRGVLVDDLGRVLSADITGLIFSEYLLENENNKTILANVECSMLYEKILGEMGAEVVRIPVGHTYLTLEAKKRNALIGIESSGHLIVPKYFLFDDGMIIPMVAGEIIKNKGKKLSNLVDKFKLLPKERIAIKVSDELKFKLVDELKEYFEQQYNIETIDGVRVVDDKWVALIRASNTSPKIRLTVEAETQTLLRKVKEDFLDVINKTLEKMKK